MNHLIVRFAGAASLLLVLACCATSTGPMVAGGSVGRLEYAPSSSAGTSARADVARSKAAAERPGLGTKLGGTIYDSSESTRFFRRLADTPDAVASFHYNDEEGAKVMSGLAGTPRRRGGEFELMSGRLKVAVESRSWGSGCAFDYYEAGGRAFVIGKPGASYRLRLHNLSDERLEVVVSVDGLDVLDGQPATVRKRGYVIEKRGTITVEGMRVNGQLRTLEFGTVSGSRAATGFGEKGARNVGVIGVACYAEDEAARRRANVEEGYVREGASAFRN